MTLGDKVFGAIQRSKLALGDLLFTTQVTKVVNGEFVDGKPTTSEVTFSADCFIDQWTQNEMAGDVRYTDVKLCAFPASKDIETNDFIVFRGERVKILRATPMMAGTRTALTILQLRK